MQAINFIDHPMIVVFVLVSSWPIYRELAKIFYGSRYEKFAQTLLYLFQCDWHSAWKGEYWEDHDATFKFSIFILLCLGWVCAISEWIVRLIYF